MKDILCGIDIGGTKCAVALGRFTGADMELIDKRIFETPSMPQEAIHLFNEHLELMLDEIGGELCSIGISCGSPINAMEGLILAPPNLPTWERVDIISDLKNQYRVPILLQNDANAGALAEWKWGIGRGTQNMVFLTFGTGIGAGLILNGQLYSGTNDFAGEIGHIRLEDDGPFSYGKFGSVESYCSGGGIAQLGKMMALKWLLSGKIPEYCPSIHKFDEVTTKLIADYAQSGGEYALEVLHTVGRKLGKTLSILVDLLNPEIIVIGGIFGRQRSILEPVIRDVLEREALPQPLMVCKVVSSTFGEDIGNYASLSIAELALQKSI